MEGYTQNIVANWEESQTFQAPETDNAWQVYYSNFVSEPVVVSWEADSIPTQHEQNETNWYNVSDKFY